MIGPIAYLTGEYPRATDTFIQREVAGLRALGFDVHTFTIRRTAATQHMSDAIRAEAAGTFAVLPTLLSLAGVFALMTSLLSPGRLLSALALAQSTAPKGIRGRAYALIYLAEAIVLAHQLRGRGIKLLHNHIAKASCTVAMLAAQLASIPYSFTLHGPDDLAEPGFWRLDAKIARAAFVACISDYARAQAMVVAGREHWSKLHVIHCGVDPDRYAGRPERPGNHLVFVGRLAAVKGVPVLLQALLNARMTHPDLRLTLIGDGPERAALQAEATALGLDDHLTFTGYLAEDGVARVLQAADALVLPSFAEGVPVVLMESMAAGLPVIATRVAGVPELVGPDCGILVAPGDADALGDAIARLMGDADLRVAMGQAGQKAVRAGFDASVEAARLATLFQGAIARNPRLIKRPEPMTLPK
jgi:glycosyltransferase involved in cell wall biosynthesis